MQNLLPKTKNAGFTLLEMTIAMGIFSMLSIIAIGITVQTMNTQVRTAEIQSIQDNIRFSLELITKELRTGTSYQLSGYGAACGGGSEISFTANTPTGGTETHVYYLATSGVNTGTIMRIKGGTDCSTAAPFTASEVTIDKLSFQIHGATPGGADGQPIVTVALHARSKNPAFITSSDMNIQTSVTQRLRDL